LYRRNNPPRALFTFLLAHFSIQRGTNDMTIRTLLAAGAAFLIAACASAGSGPAMVSNGVLTNSAGMTLYTFDKDPAGSGKSVCNGPCAKNWPPLMAMASDMASGDWSVVTRDDGSKQWAYKGKPLYLWVKDQKPGDTTGDGFNKVWSLAKP
jgi:predicted lipoprotein with Yx(FWY)xxD motif